MRSILAFIGLTVSVLSGCQRPQGAEARFWSWFQQNASRVARFEQDQERVFNELQTELQRVHPGLTFEIGPVTDGTRKLVVSADGIREHFPAVQALVAAAPSTPGWRVVAFRQRKSSVHHVRMGDLSLGPEDVWFKARGQPGKRLDVELFIRGYAPEEHQRFAQVGYLMLDDVLGEFDVETKVGGIGFAPLPDAPEVKGLKPLPALAAEVDAAFPRAP